MRTDLGSVATLRQSRAPLSVNGERGLSVKPLLRLSASRQWRSHQAPLVTQDDHGSPYAGVEPAGSNPDDKGLESPDTEGDTEVSDQRPDIVDKEIISI